MSHLQSDPLNEKNALLPYLLSNVVVTWDPMEAAEEPPRNIWRGHAGALIFQYVKNMSISGTAYSAAIKPATVPVLPRAPPKKDVIYFRTVVVEYNIYINSKSYTLTASCMDRIEIKISNHSHTNLINLFKAIIASERPNIVFHSSAIVASERLNIIFHLSTIVHNNKDPKFPLF